MEFFITRFLKLIARPGLQDQQPTFLVTLLVADIDHATPCFKFNDSMSRQIGSVNNNLNCLVFFTGKDCQGRVFKVDAQEKQVSLQKYQPSQTYSGMRMCGNEDGPGKDWNAAMLKSAHVTVTKSDT